MHEDIKNKYIDDLKEAMIAQSKHKNKVMLLSGGMDSLLLLLIAVEAFGKDDIVCYTFVGKDDNGKVLDTYDLQKATMTAKELGLMHKVFSYSKTEVMSMFPQFKGTNMKKYFDLFGMAFFRLFLNDAKITDSDIIWGEGADRLYGSVSSYVYMDTTRLAKEKGISRLEAKNMIKENWFNDKSNYSDDTYFYMWLKEGNNNIVTPYCSPTVEWINKVSFDIIKPLNKGFVREAILNRWPAVKEDLVKRKRTFMEGGTGLYDIIKEELLQQYSYIGKSINKIATAIMADSQAPLV